MVFVCCMSSFVSHVSSLSQSIADFHTVLLAIHHFVPHGSAPNLFMLMSPILFHNELITDFHMVLLWNHHIFPYGWTLNPLPTSIRFNYELQLFTPMQSYIVLGTGPNTKKCNLVLNLHQHMTVMKMSTKIWMPMMPSMMKLSYHLLAISHCWWMSS